MPSRGAARRLLIAALATVALGVTGAVSKGLNIGLVWVTDGVGSVLTIQP